MLRYLSLTKPRIIVLLAFTGVVGYMIPSLENIKFLDVLVFLFIGYASSGGAMAINNVIDRDMDIKMDRTKNRPSVGDEAISVRNILLFGIILSILGIGIGFLYYGPYTSLFLAWGELFYLFGYSLYLKKKSGWNTIIGGFASPAPVWVGYAARFENLSIIPENAFLGVTLEGWLLSGIVFWWSASHTFAMAAKNYDDYLNAGIPMLPVVVGMKKAGLITLIWGIFAIIYGNVIAFYLTEQALILVALIIPNLILLYGLWKFYKEATTEAGRICFIAHNLWLPIVFSIVVLFIWTA